MKTAEKDVSLEDVPVAQNTYPLGVPYYGFCISFMFLLQVAFASLRSSRANHGTVLTLGYRVYMALANWSLSVRTDRLP